jgi:hypothetical protein
MQFKPGKRTATPADSAAAGLHQPMPRQAGTGFPLKPLTVSFMQTVPTTFTDRSRQAW